MSQNPVIILWHPTPERFVEATAGEEEREVFLVVPRDTAAESIDRLELASPPPGCRISVLFDAATIHCNDYALFRRLQRNGWTLTLCQRTESLSGRSPAELEQVIELAQKFRIDVDFLLTLPGEPFDANDARRVFEFFRSNRVRRVSFAYPLLLSRMGLVAARVPFVDFFPAFLEMWVAKGRPFIIDDVRRASMKMIGARAGSQLPPERSPFLRFADPESEYWNVDGPVPDLRMGSDAGEASPVAAATAGSRQRCASSCAYYLLCGGDFYGAKVAFNDTLDSADNPYCAVIAKPIFAHVLAQVAS